MCVCTCLCLLSRHCPNSVLTSVYIVNSKTLGHAPWLKHRSSRTLRPRISWRDEYTNVELLGLHMPVENGENYKHISQFTEQTKSEINEPDLPVPPSYLLNATVEGKSVVLRVTINGTDDLDHEYQLPPPPEENEYHVPPSATPQPQSEHLI